MTPTADLLDRITINPDQCGGRPCIRGIRMSDVLALLAADRSQEEILETYPYLEADDITACLLYAIQQDVADPDRSQIVQRLHMTPKQRLAHLVEAVAFQERAHRARRVDESPRADKPAGNNTNMNQIERAVFPVFRFRSTGESKTKIRDGDYVGTGFFVEHEEHVVFVTARHVVDVDAEGGFIGIGDLTDNSKHDWGGFDYHGSADLAIAVFRREKAPTFVRPLPLGPVRVGYGNAVASYGFPLSGAKRQEGTRNLVRIEQMFFRGHVTTDWSREDLAGIVRRPFSVNYGLSFSAPRGLSGAPLLVESASGSLSVAGVVYGNRTIEFQVRSYEEVKDDGAVQRNVEFDAHHFGLASGLAELLEMLDGGPGDA